MEITGNVIAIGQIKSGTSQRTGNQWSSQEFTLQTQEQYPKKCCLEIFGVDKINTFKIQMGEVITACFDIDASEYNGRWFNKLQCFAIKRNGQMVQVQRQQPALAQGYAQNGYQQGHVQQPQGAGQQGNLFPPAVGPNGMPIANNQPYTPQTQGEPLPF